VTNKTENKEKMKNWQGGISGAKRRMQYYKIHNPNNGYQQKLGHVIRKYNYGNYIKKCDPNKRKEISAVKEY